MLVVEEDSQSPAIAVAEARNIPVLRLREGEAAGAFRLLDYDEGGSAGALQLRSADSTALMLHTSGTTSRPKMVPLSQANLVASARHIAATLRLGAGDRCLNIMPLFHIHGLMAPVLASLGAGAEVVCTTGFDALRSSPGWTRHSPLGTAPCPPCTRPFWRALAGIGKLQSARGCVSCARPRRRCRCR